MKPGGEGIKGLEHICLSYSGRARENPRVRIAVDTTSENIINRIDHGERVHVGADSRRVRDTLNAYGCTKRVTVLIVEFIRAALEGRVQRIVELDDDHARLLRAIEEMRVDLMRGVVKHTHRTRGVDERALVDIRGRIGHERERPDVLLGRNGEVFAGPVIAILRREIERRLLSRGRRCIVADEVCRRRILEDAGDKSAPVRNAVVDLLWCEIRAANCGCGVGYVVLAFRRAAVWDRPADWGFGKESHERGPVPGIGHRSIMEGSTISVIKVVEMPVLLTAP